MLTIRVSTIRISYMRHLTSILSSLSSANFLVATIYSLIPSAAMHRYGLPRLLSQSVAGCPFINVSAENLVLHSSVALVYGTFIDLFSTRKHKQKKRPIHSSDHKNAIARQQPAAVAKHRVSKCPMLSAIWSLKYYSARVASQFLSAKI